VYQRVEASRLVKAVVRDIVDEGGLYRGGVRVLAASRPIEPLLTWTRGLRPAMWVDRRVDVCPARRRASHIVDLYISSAVIPERTSGVSLDLIKQYPAITMMYQVIESLPHFFLTDHLAV
jgi:hypothetical protein